MENGEQQPAKEPSTEEIVLHALIRRVMDSHPTPWRVEADWAPGVYDANGDRIVIVRTSAAAELVVSLAAEIDSSDAETEQILAIEEAEDEGLPALESIPRFS